MTKYELLDSKIMSKIDAHPMPFSSLYVMDVAEECSRIAKDENKPEPFRILDRCSFRRYVNRERSAVHPKAG
ncbi:hypothetical protein AB6U14_09840 [Klebsiella pneumoniae]